MLLKLSVARSRVQGAIEDATRSKSRYGKYGQPIPQVFKPNQIKASIGLLTGQEVKEI